MIGKIAIGLIGVAALLYCGAVGYLSYNQRAFIFAAPDWRDDAPAGFSEISYETEDGLTLASGYRPARDAMPTILYFHGNGTDWTSIPTVTEPLQEAGYGILAAEYRGYRGNAGSPSEEGLYRDARGAVAWLGDQGIAPTDVIIIGNSLGSGAATKMASEISPAALILVSPIGEMTRVVGDIYPWVPVRMILKDKFDNIGTIASVSAPTLIIHGEADRLISVNQARDLAAASPNATLKTIAGEGHFAVTLPEVKQAQLAFLQGLTGPKTTGSE